MRALICTFGFDADKIILAMKCVKHDRLVLVTGTDNLEHDSFDRISTLCERLRTPLEVVTTDKFDMLASMMVFQDLVGRLRSEGFDVSMDIGGGVHTLGLAALLTAINLGIETWHIDRDPIRLPVLSGVSISSRLSADQRTLLLQIGPGARMDGLRLPGNRKDAVKRVLLELKRSGMVRVESALPDAKVSLTEEGMVCRQNMMRGSPKLHGITG